MRSMGVVSQLKKRVATECVSWRWNGNLGDDMIFAAQEAMFGDSLELGQYLPGAEAVLIGGGTFVPKRPEHPDLVQLSQRLPTAFFGTGIGDPLFWGTEYISDWIEITRNANFIGVRGPLSQERLDGWGIASDRTEWVGDPALYFAREDRSPHPFGGRLAVNLGITYGQLYGFDEEGTERRVIVALSQLARIGWEITLVSAWGPDDVVLERIKAKVPVSAVERWHEDYATALESVQKFDLVLNEKLHVGVVAACRGVPFVALCYRSKVLDFCRSINWTKFCLSTEKLNPDLIVEQIGTLTAARNEYSDCLRQRVWSVRRRLLEAVPRTVSALRNRG
jgi:polysaccharide pyruvyl transferase WcaK-like protein